MRYLYLLVFILIIGCDNMNEDELKIVFLGDSITQAGVYDKEVGVEYNGELVYPDYTGFITFLSQSVSENTKLVGKGISGDKVSDLLTRYRNCLLYTSPSPRDRG